MCFPLLDSCLFFLRFLVRVLFIFSKLILVFCILPNVILLNYSKWARFCVIFSFLIFLVELSFKVTNYLLKDLFSLSHFNLKKYFQCLRVKNFEHFFFLISLNVTRLVLRSYQGVAETYLISSSVAIPLPVFWLYALLSTSRKKIFSSSFKSS